MSGMFFGDQSSNKPYRMLAYLIVAGQPLKANRFNKVLYVSMPLDTY